MTSVRTPVAVVPTHNEARDIPEYRAVKNRSSEDCVLKRAGTNATVDINRGVMKGRVGLGCSQDVGGDEVVECYQADVAQEDS